MRIAFGADHAGYELKTVLARRAAELGHEVIDLGTSSTASVDYPDFGFAVGEAVAEGRAERGVVVCGSGIGITIAANRVPGARAGVATESSVAWLKSGMPAKFTVAEGPQMLCGCVFEIDTAGGHCTGVERICVT